MNRESIDEIVTIPAITKTPHLKNCLGEMFITFSIQKLVQKEIQTKLDNFIVRRHGSWRGFGIKKW